MRVKFLRNLKVYPNYVQCKLTPHWTVLAKPLYHDSFQLSRKRLFALQRDMTLEKGEDRNIKMFSCMTRSDRPRAVNKLPTISASMQSPSVAIVKRPGKTSSP